MPLKHAISVGIGFFIALMGLINSGIIVANEHTIVGMGSMSDKTIWITLAGLLVISIFLIIKIQGAILLGIIVAAIVGIPLSVTSFPAEGLISLPPSIEPIFFKLDFREILKPDILIVLFTFLFVDMFDTVGTLVGVSSKANMLDKDGKVPHAKQALLADAIGTTIGSLLGTSTVTTYVESSAGVSVGGRTGLTAMVVAICFALVLFLSPVFLMVPKAATSPALIIIGLFMITPITKLELENYLNSIPVFLTIIMMPLAFSISEGISFGIISYVLLRVFTGRFSQVSSILYILALLFIARYFF